MEMVFPFFFYHFNQFKSLAFSLLLFSLLLFKTKKAKKKITLLNRIILSCNTSLRFSYLFSDVEFVSQCVVDDEFTDINYKPAPDGLFSIKLGNPDQLDVQKIQKIRIQFAGNSIPRDMKNIKWIE